MPIPLKTGSLNSKEFPNFVPKIVKTKDKNDDEHSVECESASQYIVGGYHPVKIGDVYMERFEVRSKLGWGQFSTVWGCFDMGKKRNVAVKIVKSNMYYTKAALLEINFLETVSRGDPKHVGYLKVINLLNKFKIVGPHGTHYCLVFEQMGPNLLSLIIDSNYQGLEARVVKVISWQILQGLEYLHNSCKIIHTDLKPENILMERGSKTRVKIADLGNALYTFSKTAKDIQTRQYRSPEVILRAGYDTSADIWSMACMSFEMCTGEFLFNPKQRSNCTVDEDHLDCYVSVLGKIPSMAFKKGQKYNVFFTSTGRLSKPSTKKFRPLHRILEEHKHWDSRELRDFSSFLIPMLTYNPDKRATAQRCLNHRWIFRVDPLTGKNIQENEENLDISML